MGIIYKVTNKKNGKVYIGQTKYTLNKRKSDHLCAAKKQNTRFYNSIKKYGEENFLWEEIDRDDDENILNEKENFWIHKNKSLDVLFGYNMKEGGDCHSQTDVEVLLKMRKANLGKHHSEETKKKISKSRIGKTASQETKSKLSNARKGEKNNMFGKHHSEETKKKISDSKKNKELSCRQIYGLTQTHEKAKKKVICVETEIIYNSIVEASIKNNIDKSYLSKCCKNNKTAKGFHWRFY